MKTDMISFLQRIPLRTYIIFSFGIIAASAAILFLMGQVPICKCGFVKLWQGVVVSSENSQHISDWYTFSHVIHGFGFYLLFWFIGRRWPLGARLLAAVLLESAWEIFENTDFVINRYREVTISRDYYGDSVLNSTADIFAMVAGFGVAARLPLRVVVAITVFLELFVGYVIRDNLTLNIIMLLYPFRAIKEWQIGG